MGFAFHFNHAVLFPFEKHQVTPAILFLPRDDDPLVSLEFPPPCEVVANAVLVDAFLCATGALHTLDQEVCHASNILILNGHQLAALETRSKVVHNLISNDQTLLHRYYTARGYYGLGRVGLTRARANWTNAIRRGNNIPQARNHIRMINARIAELNRRR